MLLNILFVFIISIAQSEEAKPLAFPDFSAVSQEDVENDVEDNMKCVTSDGKVHKRGTESFSECMRPGSVKQTGYNPSGTNTSEGIPTTKSKNKINVRAGFQDSRRRVVMPVTNSE